MTTQQMDPAKAEAFGGQVIGYLNGAMLAYQLGEIYFQDLKDYGNAAKQFENALRGGLGPEETVTGGIDSGLAKRSRQALINPSRSMSNGRLVVRMTAPFSARSAITWNRNSAPTSASGK